MPSSHARVVFNWQLSSYFGWGVYGLHLMLNWAQQQEELLLSGLSVDESLIELNPLEWLKIRPAIDASRDLHARLQSLGGQHVAINRPVLQPLGNNFTATAAGPHDVTLSGKTNLGITFFEQTEFSVDGRERAKTYPLIVAGSRWNQRVLEDHGIGPSAVVFQGIDPTAFHPAPRLGWFDDRFAIFSGGKLEYRKGQDLAIKAFRAFAERHSDALFVVAWSSPWPAVAHSLDGDATLAPMPFLPDGRLDVSAWLVANGLRPDQFLDLGTVANSAMPRLYREMDVALFPNRCEGGTNLVAMECMACGVPVILSNNTGHLDLIDSDRCFILNEQHAIDGANHVGWGESDVEEIVEALESIYQNRPGAIARAARGADFMRAMTWSHTVRTLTQTIDPFV